MLQLWRLGKNPAPPAKKIPHAPRAAADIGACLSALKTSMTTDSQRKTIAGVNTFFMPRPNSCSLIAKLTYKRHAAQY